MSIISLSCCKDFGNECLNYRLTHISMMLPDKLRNLSFLVQMLSQALVSVLRILPEHLKGSNNIKNFNKIARIALVWHGPTPGFYFQEV